MAFYDVSKYKREDAVQFEKNLLLLSELADKPTAAVGKFWHNVKTLMESNGVQNAPIR